MSFSPTILVADDNPVDRNLIQTLLKDKEYQLVFAENGNEALARAKEDLPDLILLDVMMPEVDGFDVCRAIRTRTDLSEIPIIMVTALTSNRHLLEGIQAGADEFITKPYNVEELRARIENIIHLNRFRRLMLERKRFEWVVENADDGYLLINGRHQIIYANTQARFFLDIPTRFEPPFEADFDQLIEAQYSWEPADGWEKLQQEEGSESGSPLYLVRAETPLVNAAWLEVTRLEQPISSEGGMLIRLRDVTSQIDTQRSIWTFHKLVEHNLRQPLTQLIYSVDGLNDNLPELSFQQISALVAGALDGAKQLYGTVDGVLKYIKAPELASRGGTFPLSKLNPLLERMAANLALRGLSYENTIDADYHFPLSEKALYWVLSELLENARKFHPKKSPLVEVTVAQIEDQVKLTIMDDGRHISAERLPAIGLPYFQHSNGLNGSAVGSGLGLAMVKSLLKEIGSNLNVFNRQQPVGVVVELIFPADRAAPESAEIMLVEQPAAAD